MTIYFCFDVESVGLYGEGFAVGYCVSDGEKELDNGLYNCPLPENKGSQNDRQWVTENVLSHLASTNCNNPYEVRYKFWQMVLKWQTQEPIFVVDCGYPVEAKFLMDCVADSPEERRWLVPYPLHEVGTALLLTGQDPLENYDRLPNEMPKHYPLADARRSLRLFLECVNLIEPYVSKLQ